MCTISHSTNCPPLLDFPANPCHTNSMNKTTTATASYTINFWDGRTKEWKGCGAGTYTDINQAKLALRAHSDMCAGVVDFKLVTVS